MPFWYWHQPGAFFGMPYQNFVGWMGTGCVFISVAAVLWRTQTIMLQPAQLNLPLTIYLGNFVFAMVMSLAAGFWIPVLLGLVLGFAPAVICWKLGQTVEPSAIAPLSIVGETGTDEAKSAEQRIAA
jgi:putative membrane protein